MIPLKDSEHSLEFPIVTTAIVIINIAVFVLEFTTRDLAQFIQVRGFIPANFSFLHLESYLPLVTSQFLHGGFMHIASNMWFLWVFGDSVEERMGRVRYLLFYLLGGVFAALTQYLINTTSISPMIGASGAVAAVLGAYLRLFPRARVDALVPFFGFFTRIRISAPLMLGFWFLTQLFNGVASLAYTTVVGGVAFFAHVGGFIYGYLFSQPRR